MSPYMPSSKSPPPPSSASPSLSPAPMPVASVTVSANTPRSLASANSRNSDRGKSASSVNNNSTATPATIGSTPAASSAAAPNAYDNNHTPHYKNRRNYDHMNSYNNNTSINNNNSNNHNTNNHNTNNNNNTNNTNNNNPNGNYSNRGGFHRVGGRGGFSNHYNNRHNQIGNSNNFHPENPFNNSDTINGNMVHGNPTQVQNNPKSSYSSVNSNVNLPANPPANDARQNHPNYSFNSRNPNHNPNNPGPYYQQTQYIPTPGQFYNGFYPPMMVGNVGNGPYNQLVNYNSYVPQGQSGTGNEGFSTSTSSDVESGSLAGLTSSSETITNDSHPLLVSTSNFSASSASPQSSASSTTYPASSTSFPTKAFTPAAFSKARPFTYKPKPAVPISLRDPNSGQALDLNQYTFKGGAPSAANMANSELAPTIASSSSSSSSLSLSTKQSSTTSSPVASPAVATNATVSTPSTTKKSDVAETFRKQIQAKLALERKEKLEREKLEQEAAEKQRLEQEKLEQERLEEERLQREKLESERIEKERLEKERLEKERLEKERLEKERLEKELLEKERLEKERLEEERLQREKLENERLEKERVEKERVERECVERECVEKENAEKELLQKELLRKEKATSGRMAIQKPLIITEDHIMEKIKEESKEGDSAIVSRESTPVPVAQNPTSTGPSYSELSAQFVKSLRNSTPAINIPIVYPSPAFAPQSPTHKPGHYDIGFLMQFRRMVQYPPLLDWELLRNKIQISGGGSGGGYGGSGGNSGGFRDGGRYKNVSRGGHSNAGLGHGFGHGGMGNFGSDFNGPNSGINSLNGPVGLNSNNGRSNSRRGSRDGDLGMFNKSPTSDRRQNSSRRGGREANIGNRAGSNRSGGGGMGGSHRSGFGGSSRAEDGSMNRMGSYNNNLPLEPVEPLVRSENAWMPRLKKEKEINPSEITEETRMTPEVVQRKVNSLLNKMTLEKFDKISDQILDIATQSKYEDDGRTLRQVIELTFAKATDEAHWSSMYARFCQKMQSEIDPDIQDASILDKEGLPVSSNMLFRKYLLSRCQAEFEKGWSDKIPSQDDDSTLTEAQAMSEEYYRAAAAKRRGLGLIRFIGELYMLDMITERIIHGCIQRLLCSETELDEDPSEDLIESLSKLLTTIGEKLDSTGRMKDWLENYYAKIDKLTKSPTLPPRMKFMLLDVIDLRKRKWQHKNKEKGPKTIAEVHEDAAKAEQQKESARQQMQKNSGSRGGNSSRYNSNNNHNSNNVSPHEIANFGRFQGSDRSNNFGPSTGLLNRNSPGSRSGTNNMNSYGSSSHHNTNNSKSHSNLASSMGPSAKNILKRVTHEN